MHPTYHLVPRNGIYHFRLALPKILQKSPGKKEAHYSLKTRKQPFTQDQQICPSRAQLRHSESWHICHNFKSLLAQGGTAGQVWRMKRERETY